MRIKQLLWLTLVLPLSLAVARAESWKGGYVGLGARYLSADVDAKTSVVRTGPGYFLDSSLRAFETAGDHDLTPAGNVGSLSAGYNLQKSGLVLGVEADYTMGTGEESSYASEEYPCCGPASFTFKQFVAVKWLLTARARVGWSFGRFMPYGTAGLAAARVLYRGEFFDTFTGYDQDHVTDTMNAPVYGFGVEARLNPRWSVKGDYLYADLGTLGTESRNYSTAGGLVLYPNDIFTRKADVKIKAIRLGVHYRL